MSEPPRLDPNAVAAAAAARTLPKRFYKAVTFAPADGVDAGPLAPHRILLDGRPLRTPAKAPFIVPGRALAEAIAAEWERQGAHIDPASMPISRIVNSAIDGVAARRAEVEQEIARYACSDLVCYRAEGPDKLIGRQKAAWDPALDWAATRLDVKPETGHGIQHVSQPAELGPAVRRVAAGLEPLALAALHVVTTLTGSALLALALAAGDIDAERVWQAAHVDEDFQAELWGIDVEAARRRAARHAEFQAADRLLTLLRQAST